MSEVNSAAAARRGRTQPGHTLGMELERVRLERRRVTAAVAELRRQANERWRGCPVRRERPKEIDQNAPIEKVLLNSGTNGARIGTLLVPADLSSDVSAHLRERVVPTLEALVAIAQRRDALQLQRVETEALRRSDEIRTALLRAVSHDLRTPLTSVMAAGHPLGASTLSESERDELSDTVISQATRLAGLVDKLLDLSRLQAGAAQPRADWISIEDLLSTAAAGQDGERIDVHLSIDPDVPEIRADAAQLERAFANLLENTRHYGAAPISVRVWAGVGRVLVNVTDHGAGIPPAQQERIFEPFYQARPPVPEREPASSTRIGSGLGLAIVKGFVEANGGEIEVESLPGQGTSFVVSLPVAEAGR